MTYLIQFNKQLKFHSFTHLGVCKNAISRYRYNPGLIYIIYIRRKPYNTLRINMCFSIFCKKNTSN